MISETTISILKKGKSFPPSLPVADVPFFPVLATCSRHGLFRTPTQYLHLAVQNLTLARVLPRHAVLCDLTFACMIYLGCGYE
ncbi:MAG: hypothetical protein R3D35_11645 [Nitratireductor sp.]